MKSEAPLHWISGMPPGDGGAGQFLSSVQACFAESGSPLVCVHPRRAKPLRVLVRKNFARAGMEALARVWGTVSFGLRCWRAGHTVGELIVMHPQRLGWNRFCRILERRARTTVFVLDNSFFCARAYNVIPGEFSACLRCLDNSLAAAEFSCAKAGERARYQAWRERFAEVVAAGKVRFLAQTEGQAALLRRVYGASIEIGVVGLTAPAPTVSAACPQTSAVRRWDLVYHGNGEWAKGAGVVRELARRMPTRSFLVPVAADGLQPPMGEWRWPANVQFHPMRWESGLADAVRNARIVLCPSLWSAPVEAAVLKSLAANGVVALVRQAYHFSKEIPDGAGVMLEGSDWDGAAMRLEKILDSSALRKQIESRGFTFIDAYSRRQSSYAALVQQAFSS